MFGPYYIFYKFNKFCSCKRKYIFIGCDLDEAQQMNKILNLQSTLLEVHSDKQLTFLDETFTPYLDNDIICGWIDFNSINLFIQKIIPLKIKPQNLME